MRSFLLGLVLLPVTALVAAGPGGPARCQPVIERGWVRMAPGMPMGAGFARLRNPCGVDVEIVGATSPTFGDVSLHETRVVDGVSRMRAVERITLRAGASVELRPGGLHAMLMEPQGVPGGRPVRIEFLLADGRRVGGDFPVRATAP